MMNLMATNFIIDGRFEVQVVDLKVRVKLVFVRWCRWLCGKLEMRVKPMIVDEVYVVVVVQWRWWQGFWWCRLWWREAGRNEG